MARGAAGLLAFLICVLSSAGAQLRPVEVSVSGRAGIDSLALLGFEVASVRSINGTLRAVIVVSPETEPLLARRGYKAERLEGAARVTTGAAADSFRMFRSFDRPGDGIRATLAAWSVADTLIHVDSIGASYEGRPILAVKIGQPDDSPQRPNVLFLAAHHAREWISTAVALELIRWLADSAAATVTSHDVWVIPVENPDGYQYTFTTDRYWRKNRRPNGGGGGSVGVDLNRNYPAFWGIDDRGSSGEEYAETYRGTSAGSEAETQAIMAFHAVHRPVLAVSYHSYSGLILYPWGFRSGALAPDLSRLQTLAGTDLAPTILDQVTESSIDRYHPGPGWSLYPTNGEYTDWAYRAHGTIAFTVELTSGCCANSEYYGFEFPDDSARVEQVFRSNLPFALSVIAASSDLAGAPGVSGLTPHTRRFTTLWPEARLSLDVDQPRPATLTVRTRVGGLATRGVQGDSLGRGTLQALWQSDLRLDGVRALRADGSDVTGELITLAGAEPLDARWGGRWGRDTIRVAGQYSWYLSGTGDTLTSPIADLRGRSEVWLQFWTRHYGSAFTPEQRGIVQFSPDSGHTWSDVAVIVGEGTNWYPLRVDLPAASGGGASGAQVRFISTNLPWWVDAAGFASDATLAFVQTQAAAPLEFSENPVRSDQVVISWPPPAPPASTDARVEIYTFTGERIFTTTVAPPGTEYVWDLTLGSRRVVNGAYIVVVGVGGQTQRRRLFIDRPAP